MQVHPTRAFSRENFGSPYGKAESWLILDTRPGACIYFGFSRQISKEAFAQAVERSKTDKSAMTEFVNCVPVQPGDVFFVDAGVIHAIGAGCLILEVQEPTDFTVQPEYWCGDYLLNHEEMYLSLDEDTALDCFDYTLYGAQVVTKGKKEPKVFCKNEKLTAETLIGPEDTPCFRVDRYKMTDTETVLDTPASVWICVEGQGRICADGYERPVKKGDYFFLPAAAAGKCKAVTENNMTLVCCVGGK